MSVSPPCASPLERVQSTRARFVRAKPDPVLRFDSDSISFYSLLEFVNSVTTDREVNLTDFFWFSSTERVLAALLATETKYLPEVRNIYFL